MRFLDPKNSERLIDPEKEKFWMPVDLYVGGAEHAVLHLLYARFWHKVLCVNVSLSTLLPLLPLSFFSVREVKDQRKCRRTGQMTGKK